MKLFFLRDSRRSLYYIVLTAFLGILFTAYSSYGQISKNSQYTVVLVPGFFNSLSPGWTDENGKYIPYWSPDIVKVFKSNGFQVEVASNLSPLGTVEENSRRLDAFLTSLNTKKPLILVGHSAGGLYSVKVASLNKHNIKKVVTVSTPFNGADFLKFLDKNWSMLVGVLEWLSLDSIVELTPQRVCGVTKNLQLPSSVEVLTFGGYQKRSLVTMNAKNLNWPYYLASMGVDEYSDGIVTLRSGMAYDKSCLAGVLKQQRVINDVVANLDHGEQNLHHTIFKLIGVVNTEWIKKEQIRFYSEVIRKLQPGL